MHYHHRRRRRRCTSTFKSLMYIKYETTFHLLYSPVGYRLEPVLYRGKDPQISIEDIDPVLVSHHKGRDRLQWSIRKTIRGYIERFRDTFPLFSQWLLGKRSTENINRRRRLLNEYSNEVVLNSGRRTDYMLQEHPLATFWPGIIASVAGAHLGYWHCRDTCAFMLHAIIEGGPKPYRVLHDIEHCWELELMESTPFKPHSGK